MRKVRIPFSIIGWLPEVKKQNYAFADAETGQKESFKRWFCEKSGLLKYLYFYGLSLDF